MPGLNEADTCRVHIAPALKAAGWCDPHWRIAEQHYFTDGQIYLVGDNRHGIGLRGGGDAMRGDLGKAG